MALECGFVERRNELSSANWHTAVNHDIRSRDLQFHMQSEQVEGGLPHSRGFVHRRHFQALGAQHSRNLPRASEVAVFRSAVASLELMVIGRTKFAPTRRQISLTSICSYK